MNNILESIEAINQTTTDFYSDQTKMSGMEYYLSGGCVDMYNILRSLYPNAKMYIKHDRSHVVTEIDGNFYDASGVVNDSKYYSLATKDDILFITLHTNNYFNYLNIGENLIDIFNSVKQNKGR